MTRNIREYANRWMKREVSILHRKESDGSVFTSTKGFMQYKESYSEKVFWPEGFEKFEETIDDKEWPLSSPDHSLIENPWNIMKKKMTHMTIFWIDQLEEVIINTWTPKLCDNLWKFFEIYSTTRVEILVVASCIFFV